MATGELSAGKPAAAAPGVGAIDDVKDDELGSACDVREPDDVRRVAYMDVVMTAGAIEVERAAATYGPRSSIRAETDFRRSRNCVTEWSGTAGSASERVRQ
jgi:hypothetical protein